jgi:ribosomal 50S subunit-recycling heat shock protein
MRLDQYLSKVGIVKRRTVAKELADNGHVKLNGRNAKPSASVAEGDIIQIAGNRAVTIEIKKIPAGNVSKENRPEFFSTVE